MGAGKAGQGWIVKAKELVLVPNSNWEPLRVFKQRNGMTTVMA